MPDGAGGRGNKAPAWASAIIAKTDVAAMFVAGVLAFDTGGEV